MSCRKLQIGLSMLLSLGLISCRFLMGDTKKNSQLCIIYMCVMNTEYYYQQTKDVFNSHIRDFLQLHDGEKVAFRFRVT
ncbi:hypothetical protein HAV_00553 [Candidatus Hepatincola sp. Av]